MRELKFRCYSIPYAIMYTPITSRIIVESENNFNDNIKIMQYTGLLDKQDIEIYEGDIVRDSSNRIMIVEWDDRIGTSRFIFKTINNIGHIKNGRYLNTNEWITSTENDIEVIGNIYEQSYLLDNN